MCILCGNAFLSDHLIFSLTFSMTKDFAKYVLKTTGMEEKLQSSSHNQTPQNYNLFSGNSYSM